LSSLAAGVIGDGDIRATGAPRGDGLHDLANKAELAIVRARFWRKRSRSPYR
jgi:hypothetical protein